MGQSPWQNPLDAHDLDDDGAVSPGDALVAINAINTGVSGDLSARFAPPQLQGEFEHAATSYFDADGDGSLSPGDPLTVINAINSHFTLGAGLPDVDQAGTVEGASELSLTNGFARVRGVITGNTDVDVFEVVAAKSRLHVALFSRGSEGLTITVFSPAVGETEESTLGTRQIEAGSHRPAKLNLEVDAGKTYYIEIKGTGGPYALAVLNFDELTFLPQPDSELGDDIHTDVPTVLRLERGHAEVVSNIDGAADVDIFQLTTEEGKLLISAAAEFDLKVELSDAGGVLRTLTVSRWQAATVNVSAGTYFIKVMAANATDTGVYRLNVASLPSLGDGTELPPGHPANRLVEEVFKRLDADGDGIAIEDLQSIAGPFSRIADSVFAEWDTDDNGSLTIEEVTAGLSTLPPLLPQGPRHDGPGPLRRVFGLRLDGR